METQTTQEIQSEINPLNDGNTNQIPPFAPIPETPEMIPNSESLDYDIYTLDEFKAGFCGAFEVAGEVTGVQAFKIKEKERAGADKTAEKIYSIANRWSALRFIISKKTFWLYDASLIAMFVWGKTADVSEEVFKVSLRKKVLSWFGIKSKTTTVSESGFLGRLGLGKQQNQEV